MKTVLLTVSLMFSSLAFATLPKTMPASCQEKLIEELEEGSLELTGAEIVSEIKKDWRKNSSSETAKLNFCGNDEFLRITVDKASCSIIDLDGGQSDGDCFEN